MTAQLVPISPDGFYTQKITLDGNTYNLTFRYNTRMDAWVVDIADASDVVLLTGLPIRESWPLTDKFAGRVTGLFMGRMLCIDMTRQHREPGELLLGGDCPLFYVGA